MHFCLATLRMLPVALSTNPEARQEAISVGTVAVADEVMFAKQLFEKSHKYPSLYAAIVTKNDTHVIQ